jgi:hypothetical protein
MIDSDLWFEPKQGLNIIYGKNGVGKSTLINFIDAIVRRPTITAVWDVNDSQNNFPERTNRSPAEQGEGRVVVRLAAPTLVDLADGWAEEVRIESGLRRRRRGLDNRWLRKREESERVARLLASPSGRTTKWTDEQVHQGIAQLTGRTPDEVKALIDSLPDDLVNDNDTRMGLLFELTKQILQNQFNPEAVRSVTDALRATLEFHYTEWSPESAVVEDINERLSTYGIDMSLELDDPMVTRDNLRDLRYNELYLLFVDVIIGRLQHELSDVPLDVGHFYADDHGRLDDFDDSNPLTFSSVRTDAEDIIGIVARAVIEQRTSPLVSYGPHDGPGQSRSVHLLLRTSDPEGVGEHTALLEKRRLEWSKLSERDHLSFEDQVLNTWLVESMVIGPLQLDFKSYESGTLPFYELRFPIGTVEQAPFEVFRLDDNLDLDRVLAVVAEKTLDRELFEALAIIEDVESDGSDLARLINPLNEVFKPVSDFIASLGIGIDAIEAKVVSSVSAWLSGQGIQLRFRTSTRNVRFGQLSTAQQFWVKAGMKLVAAQKSDSRVLVIADEPDRSLHERAAYNVMEAIAATGLDAVMSSHSIAALRTRRATLHHLEIGPYSRRTISEVALGEDVLVAAERLGTTPYDLLSLKRMMVLVEGAHDAAVVGRLIEISENKRLADRILVAPMRGVRNVVSAADSILLTEFSELNLLVIVDNGRNEIFKPILDELREGDSQGASEKQLKQVLQSHRSNREATYEERMLFDLLERAIHRGILRRLDLFALSVGDVVELLPADGFGSALGWEELRRQYQLSNLRTDFKTWLRESHQISVSVRTVEKAFDNSDSLHPELIRLLQEIELGCSA